MNYIELLKNYNAWRRGDDDIEQPDPIEIGKAIDWAIEVCVASENATPIKDTGETLGKA